MYASYLTDRYLKAIIHEIICYKHIDSIFVKITNQLSFRFFEMKEVLCEAVVSLISGSFLF